MTNTEKYVAVEIGAFGHGMKTMFQGVAEIFASMGTAPPEDMEAKSAGWIPNGKEGAGEHENAETGPVPAVGNASPAGVMGHDDNENTVSAESVTAGGHADVNSETEADPAPVKKPGRKSSRKPAEKAADGEEDKAEDKAVAMPTDNEDGRETIVPDTNSGAGKAALPNVSQDDITKIIVQKIKQDRSNNEKIGQLLKTYGVSKVSDLPSGRYEAFITDLAAI